MRFGLYFRPFMQSSQWFHCSRFGLNINKKHVFGLNKLNFWIIPSIWLTDTWKGVGRVIAKRVGPTFDKTVSAGPTCSGACNCPSACDFNSPHFPRHHHRPLYYPKLPNSFTKKKSKNKLPSSLILLKYAKMTLLSLDNYAFQSLLLHPRSTCKRCG